MKQNKLMDYGERIFDYSVLTSILNIALFLLIPFIPVYMGVVAYVLNEEKSIKSIFSYIKRESKVILPISVFLLLIIGVFYINVVALQAQDTLFYYIVQALSYVLLFVGIIVFIYSPAIIYYMNVTTKQAIYNSLLLPLHNPINALVVIGTITGFVYIGSHSLLVIIFGQYAIIYAVSKMIKTNILKIKERRK